MQLVISVLLFFSSLRLSSTAAAYHNVKGGTLQSCSSNGMALTGYTRNGSCIDENDDLGSHHICIDMSSATGGNFCEVTGQNDWCSSEEMPCHDGDSTSQQYSTCPIQHWCVCQWAFASYLESAGGCDYIQDIVCEAVNVQAVFAYQQKQQASQKKYQVALECLVERCGVHLWRLRLLRAKQGASYLLFGFSVLGSVAILLRTHSRRRQRKDPVSIDTTKEESLVNYDVNSHQFQ